MISCNMSKDELKGDCYFTLIIILKLLTDKLIISSWCKV